MIGCCFFHQLFAYEYVLSGQAAVSFEFRRFSHHWGCCCLVSMFLCVKISLQRPVPASFSGSYALSAGFQRCVVRRASPLRTSGTSRPSSGTSIVSWIPKDMDRDLES